jgi:hypothetical protein
MPRPLFTSWKDPVPIVQEAGWAQGRSGQVRKISPPPAGFDPRIVHLVASQDGSSDHQFSASVLLLNVT